MITLLITVVLAVSSEPSHARPENPPPQLTKIFKDMSMFETAFKSGNWDTAMRAADKIDKTFNQMSPQFKRELYGYTDNDYNYLYNNIKVGIKSRNVVKVEFHFIELHDLVFSLIAKYDYKIPPIITIINKYIHEAEEAANKNNYSRVVSEMNEIIALFNFVEKHLLRIDTMRSDGKKIRAKLGEIRSAGLTKQNEVIKEGIISLKNMMDALLLEINRTNKLL